MFNKHLLMKDARNVMEEMQKDRQGAKGHNRTSWNHAIMQKLKLFLFWLLSIIG